MAEKETRGRKPVGKGKKKKVYKTSRLIGHTILKAMPEIQKTPYVDLARGKILELVRLDIDTTSFTEDDFNVFKEDVMKCRTPEKLIEFLFNTILETEGMGENLKND